MNIEQEKDSKLRILNLLPQGNQGGVERLCLDVARLSPDTNYFYFIPLKRF